MAFRIKNRQSALTPLEPGERAKRRREFFLIGLLGLVFILLTIAEFRLTKISHTLPFVNSIFFFGLLNFNIIVLIALIWLVFRNIGKLLIERRRKILGARLKTKLVIAFFSFSVIPTLVLFVISALYINSSFDKWFSIKIQNTLQASLEITGTYYKNADQRAVHFARILAEEVGKKFKLSQHLSDEERLQINTFVQERREYLNLDGIELYFDPFDERLLSVREETRLLLGPHAAVPGFTLETLDQVFSGVPISVKQQTGNGDLIRSLAPIRLDQVVVGAVGVTEFVPMSLSARLGEITTVYDDYKDTNPLKYPMKTTYLVILVMITLVLLFVAIWIGLYMARELTVPLERLVFGAKQVGAGNLDVAIAASGHDEISVLVESFNRMTSDLRESRTRLLETSADLERRRLQLETVLSNVETAVLSLDHRGYVTTANQATQKLLGISPAAILGRNYAEVLGNQGDVLLGAIENAIAAHSGNKDSEAIQWSSNIWQEGNGSGLSTRTLSAIVTPLREGMDQWGAVLVIDDVSHVLKGQREMAWREVARRIAHEIKNPLTPIKLSAQRLQRRMGDYRGKDAELLKECTDTIIQHTDELKEMVNEFSNFARLPEISPARNDLNLALSEVIALYQQGHADLKIQARLEAKLPQFEFDRDQIKRVFINLLDNSVAALHGRPSPEITIATHFNEHLEIAAIEVSDNGAGMTDEVRARVFEPYFSTKQEGTGLGLAIVKRIVNDHEGFIRIFSAPGEGTRFLVELPTSPRMRTERRLS
jgi:two-component system nitrogen regulation sensor histidine kinase NtrY